MSKLQTGAPDVALLTCPQCKQQQSARKIRLVRSQVCGHGVCFNCFSRAHAATLNFKGELEWAPGAARYTCPLCGKTSEPRQVSVWLQELREFETAHAVRARVTKTMNADRACFESTPQYEDYVETREDIIDTLCNCQDRKLVAEAEQRLTAAAQLTRDRYFSIQERAKLRRNEELISIAAREGVFYELLKQQYRAGFQIAEQALVHPIELQHAELFAQRGAPTDAEPPATPLVTSAALAKLATLKANLPHKLATPRAKEPGKLRAAAAGFDKAKASLRTKQELSAVFLQR